MAGKSTVFIERIDQRAVVPLGNDCREGFWHVPSNLATIIAETSMFATSMFIIKNRLVDFDAEKVKIAQNSK